MTKTYGTLKRGDKLLNGHVVYEVASMSMGFVRVYWKHCDRPSQMPASTPVEVS